MTFSDFSNYVSTVSGIMTIIGISGIVSWSVSERFRSNLAARVFSVLTYSMKTSIALSLFIPTIFAWKLIYRLTIQQIGDGTFSYQTFFWDNTQPFANFFAYLVSLGFFIPLYAISVACVYQGSLKPAAGLIRTLIPRAVLFDS